MFFSTLSEKRLCSRHLIPSAQIKPALKNRQAHDEILHHSIGSMRKPMRANNEKPHDKSRIKQLLLQYRRGKLIHGANGNRLVQTCGLKGTL
jgi:hypothetical protein